ncbi:MAG: helix-turn-helix domain-containing protein [Firmicutes bacterium]|nr:helix-turn-helix domain-containing protein [Alicyclobacillaceae bacterium]MCL6498289.1 helix-turn-helix domain-containing protein [Bacillota bacterium]
MSSVRWDESRSRRVQAKLQKNLRDVLRGIGQVSTANDAVAALVHMIRDVFRSDVAIVYAQEGDGQRFFPQVAGALPGGAHRLPPLERSQISPRVLEGTFRWPSEDTAPLTFGCAFFDQMEELGFTTWFSLPMQRADQTLGIIVVAYYRHEELLDDVAWTLWEFAQTVANVLFQPAVSDLPTGDAVPVRGHEGKARQWMQRLLAFYHELTKSLWVADSLQMMTDSLAEILQYPVAVIDRLGGLLSRSPNDGSWKAPAGMVQKWLLSHPQFGGQQMPMAVRTEALRGNHFLIAPIQIGSTPLGYLVVWEKPHPLDDVGRMMISQGAGVLAVHFYKHGLYLEQRKNRFQELFNHLIEHPAEWGSLYAARAIAVGWNVYQAHRMLVANFAVDPTVATGDFLHPENLPPLFNHLATRLSTEYPRIFLAQRRTAWIFVMPDALVAPTFLTEFIAWVRAVIAEWRHSLPEEAGIEPAALEPTFGLSTVFDRPELVPSSFQTAYLASRLAKTLSVESPYVEPEHVRIHTLLLPLLKEEQSRRFVIETVGPLLDASQRCAFPLMDTLRTYLHFNGNLSKTTSVLFIHRTTLQYRLRQIEEILGRSLSAPQTRFELQVALVLLDLMGVQALPM